MKKTLNVILASAIAALALAACSTPENGAIEPVDFTHVQLTDNFLLPRMKTNEQVTIPHALAKCESEGRFSNFKRAAGLEEGRWQGHWGFDDSDVYKVLEGMAYTYNVSRDEALRVQMDTIISWVAAAQMPDGYLYTPWQLKANDYMSVWCCYGKERYDNLYMSHEFYNMGHMYEAAVAHYTATGQTNFLDVAVRSAEHIWKEFGPDGRVAIPGHQEIEIGLLRLAKATGEPRYAQLAKLFLDRRGHGLDGGSAYNQNDVPAVDLRGAAGHAVRANYMYSAMTDVAIQTGDPLYAAAVDSLWDDVVGRKLYLTGGMGALYDGEAYGEPYYLPNRSYAETCASIAGVFWNQRMFQLHADAAYVDVLERILYNGLLSGISLDGTEFFYPNPLYANRDFDFNRGNFGRSEWFDCSCCPTNDVRFLSSLPGYFYAVSGNTVYQNLYASSVAAVNVGGAEVTFTQTTGYPWRGEVTTVVEAASPLRFCLKVRIPHWATGSPLPGDLYTYEDASYDEPVVCVNGKPVGCTVQKGYVSIDRRWRGGDVVSVSFAMPVRKVLPNPAIEEDRGKTAFERGPLVYCFEEVDNGNIDALRAPAASDFETVECPDLLGGVTVLRAGGLTAVPYCVWDNRGDCPMTVWLDE